jgi:hypothetical protein
MMREDPKLTFISQKSDVANQILGAFGIDMKDRLIPYRLSSRYCARELYYPHGWPQGYNMGSRSAELIYYAHRQLFPVDLAPSKRPLIIYASRTGQRARGALNEQEVLDSIRKWMDKYARSEQLHIWTDGQHTVCLFVSQHLKLLQPTDSARVLHETALPR